MPRKQRLHHYIYKTTCRVTGKFYVGMHSTDDLNDGYLGSGKILGYSIAKNGKENHNKEILEHCQSREALKLREMEIVNEAMLANPLNINLKYGGEGGGRIWNQDHAEKLRKTGCWARGKQIREFGQHPNSLEARRSSSLKSRPEHRYDWTGKKHSAETRIKMRKSKNQGEANSQHGTCWVTRDGETVKIKKESLDAYVQNGFHAGRK